MTGSIVHTMFFNLHMLYSWGELQMCGYSSSYYIWYMLLIYLLNIVVIVSIIGQDQKVMGQKQGEAGQGEGCGPIDLPFLLKTLKFILSSEPQILQLAASKQPHLVLPSLQLLIAVFSCCKSQLAKHD